MFSTIVLFFCQKSSRECQRMLHSQHLISGCPKNREKESGPVFRQKNLCLFGLIGFHGKVKFHEIPLSQKARQSSKPVIIDHCLYLFGKPALPFNDLFLLSFLHKLWHFAHPWPRAPTRQWWFESFLPYKAFPFLCKMFPVLKAAFYREDLSLKEPPSRREREKVEFSRIGPNLNRFYLLSFRCETGKDRLPGCSLGGCQGRETKLWFFTMFGSQSEAAAVVHWCWFALQRMWLKEAHAGLWNQPSLPLFRRTWQHPKSLECRKQNSEGVRQNKSKGHRLKLKGEAKGLFQNICIRGRKMLPTSTYIPRWL